MYGHQFDDVEDSTHSCRECGVLVHDDALESLTLDCPVTPCSSPSNRGEPCVFVMGRGKVACSYCEAPGDPDADDIWDDDFDEPWLVEVGDDELDELARLHGWRYPEDDDE